jgi:hypothetical protein
MEGKTEQPQKYPPDVKMHLKDKKESANTRENRTHGGWPIGSLVGEDGAMLG